MGDKDWKPKHVRKVQVVREKDLVSLDDAVWLRQRLIGEGGQNLKHIHEQTGAFIWVCGVGSDGTVKDAESEAPLHLVIKSDDESRDAEDIAKDLVGCVWRQYDERINAGPWRHGRGKGKGKCNIETSKQT